MGRGLKTSDRGSCRQGRDSRKAFLLATSTPGDGFLGIRRYWSNELVSQVGVEKLSSPLCSQQGPTQLHMTLQPGLVLNLPLAQSPPKSAPAGQTQL